MRQRVHSDTGAANPRRLPSGRALWLPVLWIALLASCTPHIRRGPALEDFRIIPGLTALPRGDERYDCGPEALSAVFTYYGKPISVQEISKRLFNRELRGTVVAKIPDFIRSCGYDAQIRSGSIAHLKAGVDERRPLVVMVKLKEGVLHFFVVVAYSDKHKTLAFLDYPQQTGPQWAFLPYDLFSKYWLPADNFMLEIIPAGSGLERAVRLDEAERWEEAQAAYEEVLKENPRSVAACVGLGYCRYFRGDAEGGIQATREALKIVPDEPQALNNLAHMLSDSEDSRAEALAVSDRAVEACRKAIRRLTEEAEEARDSAKANLRALVDLRREHLESSLGTRGGILHLFGRHEEAAQAYLEAGELGLRPDTSAARFRQAVQCFRQAGDEKRAAEIEGRLSGG